MAIRINLGGAGGRGRRRHMDLSAPPVEMDQTEGRGGALFLILFSLMWIGIPASELLSTLQSGDVDGGTLMFLGFFVAGIGILLFAVRGLLWRRRVAFDGGNFTVTERGLTGARSWTEPLSAYDGVMRSTRRVKTKNSSYTLYMIDLVHPDPDRKINLYTDTSNGRVREIWEDYSSLLTLPALEQGEGGMVRREAADLNKSVGELIREGKVEIDYDALSHPVEGLAVDLDGDMVALTRTGPKTTWLGSLIAVTFPLVFVGVGFFAPNLETFGRVIVGGAGILFEILFVIGVYKDLTSRERLRIGPAGARINQVGSSGESKGKFIPADEIEAVTIGGKDNEGASSLVVSSDRKTFRFGGGLSRPALEYAMNTVLAKIAETERRGGRY